MSGGALSTAHWTTSARSSRSVDEWGCAFNSERKLYIKGRTTRSTNSLLLVTHIESQRNKMASEAQRIMNVSLTKIVSSRSRRGGVSLHRNLLVASVLFKARDVYAAEMSGLVVIRNGFVYDRSAVDDCGDTKVDPQDLSNESLSTDESHVTSDENSVTADENLPTDENLIRDEQIMQTVSAVVCPSLPDSTQEQSENFDSLGGDDKSPSNMLDSEQESCKENIEPVDPNQVATDSVGKIVKRKRKSQSKQCLKRKCTEVEQAVLSITESDGALIPKKMSRVETVNCDEKTDLSCSEPSSSLLDWASDRLCVNREESQVTTSQDFKSCMDTSEDAYSSSCAGDDDDQSSYDDISSYQSSFHSFNSDYCTSSSSTDAISFSLSHPMLIISV